MTDHMTDQEFHERLARERGVDPLMERSFGRLLSELPKRLVTMISKTLSLKGVVFATWVTLTVLGKTETWALLVVTLVYLFGREALRYITELRR